MTANPSTDPAAFLAEHLQRARAGPAARDAQDPRRGVDGRRGRRYPRRSPTGPAASLSEFERDFIRERTIEGLAAARARGRRGGRPTVWTEAKLRTAVSMQDAGEHDIATIAQVLGVSRTSVYRALASAPEDVTP